MGAVLALGAVAAVGAWRQSIPPEQRAEEACAAAYGPEGEATKECELRLLVRDLDAQESAKAAQAARDF